MSTTQGRRRMREEDDEDADVRPRQRRQRDDEDEAGADSDSGGDEAEGGGEATRSADEQMAAKLVRYALSCEYSRVPIRRDGIKERVLGSHGRSFRRVFALAQKQLNMVWGMELRELPAREKMTLQEKRKAIRANSQPKTGTGSYILCSTLPEGLRDPAIIPPSRAPSHDDEATYAAFYTLVVSCIWLNGGELTEQKLRRYLVRLNADRNVAADKTEAILKKMERQGYVVRHVERQGNGGDANDQLVTWHVGARAKEEIGLDGVMGLVSEVYGGATPDLEKKLHASLGIKHRRGQAAAAVAEEAEAAGNDSTVA